MGRGLATSPLSKESVRGYLLQDIQLERPIIDAQTIITNARVNRMISLFTKVEETSNQYLTGFQAHQKKLLHAVGHARGKCGWNTYLKPPLLCSPSLSQIQGHT
jgi:hypothetical protein